MLQPNKNFIFSCNHCSCTIFILISYPLYTQAMLILILIDVQYLQNVVFSFGKGSNGQNHSSSDSHHHNEKIPSQQTFPSPLWERNSPCPLKLFGKPCYVSDLSKLNTLLYKRQNKTLLVL